MKKFLIILLALVACVFCFTGCFGEKKEPDATPDDEIVTDTNAHYLIFVQEGAELEKMLVLPTDTYASLLPYFPLINEKEGYTASWEVISEVYSATLNEIYINAYYTKL